MFSGFSNLTGVVGIHYNVTSSGKAKIAASKSVKTIIVLVWRPPSWIFQSSHVVFLVIRSNAVLQRPP